MRNRINVSPEYSPKRMRALRCGNGPRLLVGCMSDKVHSRSLVRARWYGDLTAALRDAERLLLMLEADGSFPAEAGRLRFRIATVRSELELLNRLVQSEDRIVGIPWPEPARASQLP